MEQIIEYKKHLIVAQNDCPTFILNTNTNEMFSSLKSIPQIQQEIDKLTCDEATKSISKQIEYKRGINNIVIGVADRCNLKCSYCYANEGTYNNPKKSIMTQQDFQSINQILWDLNANGIDSIHFFGGEPLLAYNDIFNFCNAISEDCKRKDMPLPKFSITTNGTLLTDTVVKRLKEFDFSVCVSLDGPQNIHDASRIYKSGQGSFEQVMDGIRKLCHNNVTLAIEATIVCDLFTAWNKDQLYDYFNFFVQTGANLIGFFPDINDENAGHGQERKLHTIENFYNAMVDFYFEHLLDENASIPLFANVYSVLLSLLSTTTGGICKAGIASIYITPNGDIFPCQAYYASKNRYMGNISNMDNFWLTHHITTLDYPNRFSKVCDNCMFYRYCGAKCPGSNLLMTDDERGITTIRCESSKILIKRILLHMARIATSDEKRNIFISRFSAATEMYQRTGDPYVH